MKRIFQLVGILSLVLVTAFASAMIGHAMTVVHLPAAVQEPAPITLPDFVRTLESLGGVAMFFAALVNLGKKAGWVGDDQAPNASLVLNALGLVTLVALQVTGKFDLVPMLDQNAGLLAVLINAAVGLIFQLYVSRKTHENVLAGLPVVGESHSGRRAGEGAAIEVEV